VVRSFPRGIESGGERHLDLELDLHPWEGGEKKGEERKERGFVRGGHEGEEETKWTPILQLKYWGGRGEGKKRRKEKARIFRGEGRKLDHQRKRKRERGGKEKEV